MHTKNIFTLNLYLIIVDKSVQCVSVCIAPSTMYYNIQSIACIFTEKSTHALPATGAFHWRHRAISSVPLSRKSDTLEKPAFLASGVRIPVASLPSFRKKIIKHFSDDSLLSCTQHNTHTAQNARECGKTHFLTAERAVTVVQTHGAFPLVLIQWSQHHAITIFKAFLTPRIRNKTVME